MTETVKALLFNYAFCAFLGGFLEYFAPQKTKATLRAVVAAVIIFSVASPIAQGDFSFDEQSVSFDSEQAQTDALMHTASLAEKTIKNDLKNILINLGINEYEIYVTTSVYKENATVYLDGVEVQLGEEFREKKEDVYNSVTSDYKSVLKVGVKNE